MKLNFTLFIFLLFSYTVHAQVKIQSIDKALDKVLKKSNFPGFAIGIVKNDSILLTKGYGLSNVSEQIPFTENTIMPIASVSKTVIAFSLAKAIKLGYFEEETPINEILPFPIINPHHTNDTIRIKHLFTHTSGIFDNDKTFINSYQLTKTPTISLGNFIEDCLSKNGKYYSDENFDNVKAGTQYNYSNIASALAAYLVEIKSNTSFDEFTQKHLFTPLKLENTHWFYDENKVKYYSKLYEVNIPDLPFYKDLMNEDNSVKTYSSIIYPDGSLKTNIIDLTKFAQEMIGGFRNKSKLLTQDSYESIFKRRFEDDNRTINMSENMTNQCMFWSYNKKGRLTHTGSDPGVFAVISIDLKSNIGRIVLINANIDTENNQKMLNDLQKISNILEQIQ